MPRGFGVLVWASLLWLVAACGAVRGTRAPSTPVVSSLQRAMVEDYRARGRAWPTTPGEVAELPANGTLVVVAETPGALLANTDVGVRAALAQWLNGGGRIVTLGYASRLPYDLGVEKNVPDRCEPFRWGWDERTRLGDYRFGFQLASGRADELARALSPEPQRPGVFLVGGGTCVVSQVCAWENYPPANGEVLGVFARYRDGAFSSFEATGLVHWPIGKGGILGYSHLDVNLDPFGAEGKGRAFVRALVDLHRAEGAPVEFCVAGDPPEIRARPQSVALRPMSERPYPGQRLVGHWGWQVGSTALHRDEDPWPPQRIVDDVIVPSWQAGAGVVDLQIADSELGYPLAWGPNDRIRPPTDYRGGPIWTGWSRDAVHGLAVEAHRRGMLCQLLLSPEPAVEPDASLAALRFLARELADARGLGESAVDGFGFDAWPRDGGLPSAQMVEEFHPGAWLYSVGSDQADRAGVLGVQNARWGEPAGLPAAGLSRTWRMGEASSARALLDATTRPPMPRWRGEGWGGGAFGDWIVTQVNDTARAHPGMGAALWWRAFSPDVHGPRTVDYVHGISMDPIKAAVAGRLWATGTGGWRDAVAELVKGEVQDGFGAETKVSAATHFLQNNHLRMHGTGGLLLFDPTATAQFRPGECQVVAAPLMRTRYRGARPTDTDAELANIDFLLGAPPRPAGSWSEDVKIVWHRENRGPVPRALGRSVAPEWPQRVLLEFKPTRGMYELHLTLRGIAGDGIVQLSRDDEVVRVLPFRTGDGAISHRLPFHVARADVRTLEVEVVHGGTVAIDDMRLTWVADVAVETAVTQIAGHRAELEEVSRSSYHGTTTHWTTIGDLPGFAMHLDRSAAARNLTARRSFGFRYHKRLETAMQRDSLGRMQEPFVLASDRAGVPPLAVVPVNMSRHEHFVLEDGVLELRSQPAAFQEASVGFLFLTDPAWQGMDRNELLRHLKALFLDLLRPQTVAFGEEGVASFELPTPFPFPRVVSLASSGPFFVREQGLWYARGAQPDGAGGSWLRIYHAPGDEIQVRSGASMLRATRPGPGSDALVALEDPEPDSVTVHVLQSSALLPCASVTMGTGFDEVFINDRSWSHFDGQQIFLPAQPGVYQVRCRSHGAPVGPHVVRSRARVTHAGWNPASKELSIVARSSGDRPATAAYTAWIAGPRPKAWMGCEIIDDAELPWADPTDEGRARGKGFLIRFLPGALRLGFE